jgi:hypothetical protein
MRHKSRYVPISMDVANESGNDGVFGNLVLSTLHLFSGSLGGVNDATHSIEVSVPNQVSARADT